MNNAQESTEVLILTTTYAVEGSIALLPGSRLTDYVRQSGEFIAVTNVKVSDLKGNELFNSPFLDIGKSHIVIISPLSSVQKKSKN